MTTRQVLLSFILVVAAGAAACSNDDAPPRAGAGVTPALAESYVRLVLAMGNHDPDYVDAYYGPPEWRAQVDSAPASLDSIRRGATSLRATLDSIPRGGEREDSLRHEYLLRNTEALLARIGMLEGDSLSFDQESEALYDATAPVNEESYFQSALARLDSALPGTGPVAPRYQRFRSQFVIPDALVDTTFRVAVSACRARTLQHIPLPEGETFRIEYVTGKSWSGYNWYQGNFNSLIQVNRSLPIYIDRALDLACHEGYPGHHVFNVLIEQNLVRERGWVEYSVYPLFSPASLIAEGSANYGIRVAFPDAERIAFERDTLFPLAKLDPSRVEQYYAIQDIIRELSYAGNEAARRYLDGEITGEAAAQWLTEYALMTPEAARQRVRFFDQYRSYVINYNRGQDLVREHVERTAGQDASEERRWEVFTELLRFPPLPSELR
jgi:hypothetical protein